MPTVSILSVSQNKITVSNDSRISDTQAITFDGINFLQTERIKKGVYLVHGEVPQNATSATVGHISTTDTGTRFLTDADERQMVVDEQRNREKQRIRSVSAEQFLFQVLTDQELTAVVLSTNASVKKGLLRISAVSHAKNNEPWFEDFVSTLVAQSILTQSRADTVGNLDTPISPNA